MSALFVAPRKLGVMVNRAYLSLSVLALVLWVAAYRHLPGWAAGVTLACVVLFCEWSRVRTLARIGKSRGTSHQSSRGRKLS